MTISTHLAYNPCVILCTHLNYQALRNQDKHRLSNIPMLQMKYLKGQQILRWLPFKSNNLNVKGQKSILCCFEAELSHDVCFCEFEVRITRRYTMNYSCMVAWWFPIQPEIHIDNILLSCNTQGVKTTCGNGPLTRYVKLQVAHAPGMPGTFSPAADFKWNR